MFFGSFEDLALPKLALFALFEMGEVLRRQLGRGSATRVVDLLRKYWCSKFLIGSF